MKGRECMFFIKLVLKLLALPVLVAVLLLKWVGIFMAGITAPVLNMVASLFGIVALIGYMLGLCPVDTAAEMLMIGFLLFVVPYVAEWGVKRIAWIAYCLDEFFSW